MSEIKNGGPAFPVTYEIENGPPDNAIPGHLYPGSKSTVVCSGLTVRDYFAAKALLGLIAEPLSETSESTCVHCTPNDDETTRNLAPGERLATAAYVLADAMLRARGQS